MGGIAAVASGAEVETGSGGAGGKVGKPACNTQGLTGMAGVEKSVGSTQGSPDEAENGGSDPEESAEPEIAEQASKESSSTRARIAENVSA